MVRQRYEWQIQAVGRRSEASMVEKPLLWPEKAIPFGVFQAFSLPQKRPEETLVILPVSVSSYIRHLLKTINTRDVREDMPQMWDSWGLPSGAHQRDDGVSHVVHPPSTPVGQLYRL